jgi:hypothetical protein
VADPAAVRQEITAAITGAGARINRVELDVQPANCPLSYSFANTQDGTPPPWGPLTGPADLSFKETVKAPATPGDYTCQLRVLVDGAQRAVQRFHAHMNVPTTSSSTTSTTTTSSTMDIPETTVNTVDPPPSLPFTGAGPTEPLLVGGLTLGVVGMLTLLVTRSRRPG